MPCQTVMKTKRKGKARDLEKNRKTESEGETERDCVGGSKSKSG